MRALTIVTVAVIITLLVVITKAEDDYTSTTTNANTFFGIDRNNHESMREKHRELAGEQYKRMFGEEHPLPDFSGDLEGPLSKFTQKIREAVKRFSELFKNRPIPNTSTPEPMD